MTELDHFYSKLNFEDKQLYIDRKNKKINIYTRKHMYKLMYVNIHHNGKQCHADDEITTVLAMLRSKFIERHHVFRRFSSDLGAAS